MNLVKVINSKFIPIIILVIVALFFHSYQIRDRYTFDWDQEDDATKVMEMIENFKPRLIGPRVANESGFFVGPFHYYFLTPFYAVLNGNPYAGALAAILVAVFTAVGMYLIFSKIFNSKIAFFSALFYAAAPSVISWNVMYTPLLSLVILYFCYLLLKGNQKIFPYLIFVYSFSFTTHLVPASLILPIIITLIVSRFHPSFKQIILSIILFIIPLLPLIIFDLKHDFINILSLKNFIFSSKQSFDNPPYLFLRSFWRSLNPFYLSNPVHIIISRILCIFISLFEIVKTKNSKLQLLFLTWFLGPLIILSFYHGNIPEYYYGGALILLPVFIVTFFNRFHSKLLNLLLLTLFLVIQFQYFGTKPTGITLKNKLGLTSYLVNQNQDKIFNLSYDLPVGFNTGYAYLFKYLGKEPQNIPEGHLYSVFLTSSPPKTGQIVYSDGVLGLVRK